MEDKDYETEEAMLIRILRLQNEIRLLKKEEEKLIEILNIQHEELMEIFRKD